MARHKIWNVSPASVRGRRPVLLIAGALVFLAIALGALASCSPTEGGNSGGAVSGPSLAVDPMKIDFGQVKVDNVVKADFKLKNLGNQPLQIIGEPVVRVVQGC
jgi:hypothetical protein